MDTSESQALVIFPQRLFEGFVRLKNFIVILLSAVNSVAYGWLHLAKNGDVASLPSPVISMLCLSIGIMFLCLLIYKVCNLENKQMGSLSADREGMLIAFGIASAFVAIEIWRSYLNVIS